MLLYAIIMFAAAVPCAVVSAAIYQGHTGLIHEYHQTRVQDQRGYGQAMGKSMFVITAALFLSGIAGLFGESEAMATASVAVLLLGMAAGSVCIIAVQRKYNQGVF